MDDAAFPHAGGVADRRGRANGCPDRAALALLRRRPGGARFDCCGLAGPLDLAADRRALAAVEPAAASFVPAASAHDDRGDRLDVARRAQPRWRGPGSSETRSLRRMF